MSTVQSTSLVDRDQGVVIDMASDTGLIRIGKRLQQCSIRAARDGHSRYPGYWASLRADSDIFGDGAPGRQTIANHRRSTARRRSLGTLA